MIIFDETPPPLTREQFGKLLSTTESRTITIPIQKGYAIVDGIPVYVGENAIIDELLAASTVTPNLSERTSLPPASWRKIYEHT